MTHGLGEYPSLEISVDQQVATIKMRAVEDVRTPAGQDPSNGHWELGELVLRLRSRNDIRILVLTGLDDGAFKRPRPTEGYSAGIPGEVRNDPRRLWRTFTGVNHIIEGLTSIEKPVVAKVNGDAVGLGSSIMFACDLIVARADAVIVDHHMGNAGDVGRGSPYGLVPGDGGAGLVPSYMAPPLAKEYLMLGRAFTAADLCNFGLINYAVPPEELDAKTDEIVTQLLAKSARALAWTKRVANKALVADVNLRQDAAAAYQMVCAYQAEREGWQSSDSL